MTTPSLSIVIPTYNRAALLRQTLDSIASQTYLPPDLEVIVSDDASPDETPEVLAAYRAAMPYLRTFRQGTNLRAGNWAFVLEQARGELVFLLCDDDAIAPDFLETYLGLFAADPALDLAFGDIELRDREFRPLAPLPLPTPEGPGDGPGRCRQQLFTHHMVMSTVYRRATLLAAGGWDPQVGTHFDCTAFCRAALRARHTYHIPRPMLRFRLSPGSWSHQLATRNQAQLARWYRRKLDLLCDDARTLAPELLPDLRAMYNWHVRTVIAYLETELAQGRLRGPEARAALRGLLEVFPASRHDRLAWKMRICSVVGTAWLSALRKLAGRPDPYTSPLALFNGFAPATR